MNNYIQYGVGISGQDYMASARNGHRNTNQAYIDMVNGNLPYEAKVKDHGKGEYKAQKPPKKKSIPIFTKTGKMVVCALILGTAFYVIYKSYKSKKIAKEGAHITPENNEPVHTPSTEPTPEPAPEPQRITSTAPSTVAAQANI